MFRRGLMKSSATPPAECRLAHAPIYLAGLRTNPYFRTAHQGDILPPDPAGMGLRHLTATATRTGFLHRVVQRIETTERTVKVIIKTPRDLQSEFHHLLHLLFPLHHLRRRRLLLPLLLRSKTKKRQRNYNHNNVRMESMILTMLKRLITEARKASYKHKQVARRETSDHHCQLNVVSQNTADPRRNGDRGDDD